MNRSEIIQKLTDKDEKAAFEYSRIIGAESAESDKYLCMISDFADMMNSKNSYVRTRGFGLICAQSRWADKGQIEDVFERMAVILCDPKPITVRQCLSALHEVVLYRPELTNRIFKAVNAIDLSKYKDSMTPLIKKDIDELLKIIG